MTSKLLPNTGATMRFQLAFMLVLPLSTSSCVADLRALPDAESHCTADADAVVCYAMRPCVASTVRTDAGSTAFCEQFCSKCSACYLEGGGFDDDDCRLGLPKGQFLLSHCLDKCPGGQYNECVLSLPDDPAAMTCDEFDNRI